MKSRTLMAVTAVFALALAGCAEEGSPEATQSQTTSQAASQTASTAPSATVSPSGGTGQSTGNTLVTFTRTGGLAGTNDRLTVLPDGSWTLQSKSGAKEGKLSATEVTALKAAFEQAGFSKLPKVNDGGNVADGYTYSITYGGNEVTAKDGAVPPALQPIISTLNGLLG